MRWRRRSASTSGKLDFNNAGAGRAGRPSARSAAARAGVPLSEQQLQDAGEIDSEFPRYAAAFGI